MVRKEEKKKKPYPTYLCKEKSIFRHCVTNYWCCCFYCECTNSIIYISRVAFTFDTHICQNCDTTTEHNVSQPATKKQQMLSAEEKMLFSCERKTETKTKTKKTHTHISNAIVALLVLSAVAVAQHVTLEAHSIQMN